LHGPMQQVTYGTQQWPPELVFLQRTSHEARWAHRWAPSTLRVREPLLHSRWTMVRKQRKSLAASSCSYFLLTLLCWMTPSQASHWFACLEADAYSASVPMTIFYNSLNFLLVCLPEFHHRNHKRNTTNFQITSKTAPELLIDTWPCGFLRCAHSHLSVYTWLHE
jgi:hypothetical protein